MTGAWEGTGASVSAYNWQTPPYNRWALWHVRDVLPTVPVARGRSARVLPTAVPAVDVLAVGLVGADRVPLTVGAVLAETFTDAYVVVQDGAVVAEWYCGEGGPTVPHSLMSITKSVVGCLAGVLVDLGKLDATLPVAHYVPELADSGYAGARVRDVLDMRSGVTFREEYTNPDAEIRAMGDWLGWYPAGKPGGLYGFLATLVADEDHGGRFVYRSSEADVLGWVCERAGGAPIAKLLSRYLWQPLGAEHDADLLCDSTGTALHNGGLCVTARDLARFGQMLLDGGTVTSAEGTRRPVVPPGWLRQVWTVDRDVRTAFAASPAEAALPGGWYRNQFWFRPGTHGDVLLGLGIFGQMLHVNRRTRTVCVKFSSWPTAQDPVRLQHTLRAFDAVGGALSAAARPRGLGRSNSPSARSIF